MTSQPRLVQYCRTVGSGSAKLARWEADRERRHALHSARLMGRVRRTGRFEHYLPRAVPGLTGDSIVALQAFGPAAAAGAGSGAVGVHT